MKTPPTRHARRARLLLGALAFLAAATGSGGARAETPEQSDLERLLTTLDQQKAKLDQQEKLLNEQMRQLDAQKDALQKQQQQLDALRREVGRIPPATPPAAASAPLGPGSLGTLRGTGEPQAAQAPPAVGQAPEPQEHAPEISVLSERGGVLTPKGALVWEPAIDFSHSTNSQAVVSGFTVLPAILVGTLDISRVNHDIIQGVNTFRYGLTNRAELEVRIPYVYSRQETTSRALNVGTSVPTTTTITGHDLGDVEAAGHYQFTGGQTGWPYLIGNLRFKSRTGEDPFQVPVDPATLLPARDPTGSGFYSLEPSLTAIYPSDPAVFFGNVGYLYQFGRHVNSPLVGGSAQVDPGGAIRFSFGLGFGINEASSFSLGYDYSAFFQTKINHQSTAGTDLQIGSVLIGYSYRFSDRFSTNVTTEIGVTRDAPDTEIILRFPIKFQVFD